MIELIEEKVEAWETLLSSDPRIRSHIQSLTPEEEELFYLTVLLNPYIPHVPFYQQIQLLTAREMEVFYGGGRGGGKTDACLMGALQYAQEPAWSVGIFRLTYPELSLPGAIMDRALRWTIHNQNLPSDLKPTWNYETKTLTFPSGATIKFGHVHTEADVEKYQGPEFHMLIIDEAPQFSENKLTRLKGSVRKAEDDPLPLRVWYTGNPGGLSHEYFKEHFINGDKRFIQSLYTDNPHLDREEYERVFKEIQDTDPVLYRQWKLGDWEAEIEGGLFKREWFTGGYTGIDEQVVTAVRYWDLAGTASKTADYTAGLLLLQGASGRCYVENVTRFRLDPADAEEEIYRTIHEDQALLGPLGAYYMVRFEQEGGASAKYVIDSFRRGLPGYDVDGDPTTRGGKVDRARALIPALKNGDILVKKNTPWRREFITELLAFPTVGVHDDQVDALSGAWHTLRMGMGNPYAAGGSAYEYSERRMSLKRRGRGIRR